MGNADAVVISSLITKVNGKEDLVHIFLTDRRKYQEIVHSDNYKISKYILNYLEEYSASPQKNYVQERLECIKGYEKYFKNEKNRELIAYKQHLIEIMKQFPVEKGKMTICINNFSNALIPNIDIDILDVYLLDKDFYYKIVQSPYIDVSPYLVEFLESFKVKGKYFGEIKERYHTRGSAYLIKQEIHSKLIEATTTNGEKKTILTLSDKIIDEIDMDILDVFIEDRNVYKTLLKSDKFEIAETIKEFLKKYSSGKIMPKEYYLEKYDKYLQIIYQSVMNEPIKISHLTDFIITENKDILTLFLENKEAYYQVRKMRIYEIDGNIIKFLENYRPKLKKFSKAQKKEYIAAFAEFTKRKNDYSLLDDLIKQSQKNVLHWKKRRWNKSSQYIEQDFVTSYNGKECVFSVIGSKIEFNKWKVHFSLDVDGRNNSVPHKNKEYEILYRKILKDIQYEDTKRQKEKKREIPKNVHRITSKDFVVRTNVFRCISDKHHLEEVLGIIQVLRPDGSITEEKVTASYCKECCCYFLLRSEYDRVFNKGILLCKMIEKEEFYKSGINGFADIKGESVLMQNGYNVQAKVGLTDIQRQTILANIMDEKILSASQIISYLQFFKAQKRNLPSYKMAVDKWDADLQFTKLYQQDKKQRVFINSITKTRYRKP